MENVSSHLAEQLISAESAEAFLREQPAGSDWTTISVLKQEVDRLIGSDLIAARNLSERVDQLATVLGDPVSKGFAEASRARVLHHNGQYAEADHLYERAIQATRRAKLTLETALIQMHRVFALTQMGRYDEALRTARLSRKVLSRHSPIHLAQLETNIGILYYRQDRYSKAIEHYERARKLLGSSGSDTIRAVVNTNLAHALMETDQHGDALKLLEDATGEMERSGQKLWAAQTQFHIGYLQFLRGNYNTALTTHYQAREELTRLGSIELVAWCNHEIAEIFLMLNAFDDAAESAQLARASFTELNLPYESAQSTVIHALAAMGQHEYAQARNDLVSAREVFARNNNSTLAALIDSYLAELALRCDNPFEASQHAAISLRVFARKKLSTRAAHARLLSARAAYAEGNLTKAARMAKTAFDSIQGLFAPAVEYQSQHLLGRIERDRNRNDRALERFRGAVKSIEKLRGGIAADEFKATFLQDKSEAYEDAIAACLDQESEELLEEAFSLVESSKSRALADLMARYLRGTAETRAESAFISEIRQRLANLIEDLNWYGSQAGLAEDKGDQRSAETADRYRSAVARCERQIAQLFRQLESEVPAYAAIRRLESASVSDLSESLTRDETLIEYFSTGEYLSAFIATADEIQVARKIARRSEVDGLLDALRFQLEKFNYGAEYVDAHFGQLRRATNEILSALYKAVYLPIEGALIDRRLIVVPHGSLHYLPFHALYNGYSHLVEQCEISYAPSVSVLKLCRLLRKDREDSADSGTLVALGLSESGTPNIDDEIRVLSSLFPTALTLSGVNATRENLFRAAPAARFLHLASHGYFRRDNPMFSFLKLTDSNLHFYNLLDLKLNAEMVTLSACHTGVNKVFPGDELHGLMRGFLYAGAPSVVASLWAVNDQSTAEFMRVMYSELCAGKSKRVALGNAQLAIKEAYGHPYYWAPFVLMGNPE